MNKQHNTATPFWLEIGRKMPSAISNGSRNRAAEISIWVSTFRALVGVVAMLLVACSDEKLPRQDSKSQTDTTAARSQATEAATEAASNNTATPANESAVSSSQYSVTAETAYFFDSPQQTKPTGKYLLRGDVIYGEGEDKGFVKTRFKNPNGATVTGWLKANELRRLNSPATARNTRPTLPAQPAPQPPVSADEYNYELDEPATTTTATTANPTTGTQTAVVQVARSYFYNSSDLTQPRKAHCVQGDKVQLGESQGDAVYVSFTNWEKVTTTGWMRKDALRSSQ